MAEYYTMFPTGSQVCRVLRDYEALVIRSEERLLERWSSLRAELVQLAGAETRIIEIFDEAAVLQRVGF